MSNHFASPCSVLCMFEDAKWLYDMQLVKSVRGERNSSAILRHVSILMAYLSSEQLEGTKLLNISPKVTASKKKENSKAYGGGRDQNNEKSSISNQLVEVYGGKAERATTEGIFAVGVLSRSILRMRVDFAWFRCLLVR